MTELEPQRVRPKYSVIFVEPANFPDAMLEDGILASYNYKHLITFKDVNAGCIKAVVVGSDDSTFITDVANAVKFNGISVSQESVREKIDMYSTRLPNARIGTKSVVCEEPSCTFHFRGGCANPEVLIEDSCAEDSWCMTYEPKKE